LTRSSDHKFHLEQIHNLFDLPKTPLQKIEDDFLINRGVNLLIKREDLNDAELSGNKLHKLKYNLFTAKKEGYKTLLTFGGAYSNHIYAVAASGKRFGFNTIGVIRGEEHLPLNPTLTFAELCGMKLIYLDRTTYREKKSDSVINKLRKQFGDFYLIPEGGTNELAVKGCTDIVKSVNIDYDIICTACGTGGTLAGIIAGLPANRLAIGFAVLKGASFLISDVKNLLAASESKYSNNWSINLDYHFGGYAKVKTDLIEFVQSFSERTGITLEPIYTGKMMYGIYDLISRREIDEGLTIVAIHTGGLQGMAGLKNKIKLIE
jgi:1-aminocyclopropane-1-carboxylate deaminase